MARGGGGGAVGLPSQLVDAVKSGECVLFLGSGVNAPPRDRPESYPESHRPPVGGDLAEQLAGQFGFEKVMTGESPRNLMRVSMFVDTEPTLGRKVLIDQLTELLRGSGANRRRPSDALHALAALPFRIIVTTNYDLLFDEALRAADKDPAVLVYTPEKGVPASDLDRDPTSDEPLLFKMHGDLNNRGSIVITDEDYITFVERMSESLVAHPVPETVRYRMKKWPTLFVGYSLRDFNLRLLFRTLRWKVEASDMPRSFAVDNSPDPLIIKVWQERNEVVAFLTKDLWTFAPELYEEAAGKKFEPPTST